MSIIPPGERVIETKKCRLSGQEFIVTDKDLEFYDKISPVFGGKKYAIPSPTLCPEERERRRLCARNERNLHKRKCDKTMKDIISIHSGDSCYLVYDQKYWWSDDWSAIKYGKKFDFEQDFFGQFSTLSKLVPRPNVSNTGCENSEYCNISRDLKNCYLCFSLGDGINTLYSHIGQGQTNCLDLLVSALCEQCYEIIDCTNCYHVMYSIMLNNCRDCYFCQDCEGCQNCLFCTNLRNKQYHIFDKPCSEVEFRHFLNKSFGNIQEAKQEWKKNMSIGLRKNLHIVRSENCLGNTIISSSNMHFCFDCMASQNCRYTYTSGGSENIFDANGVRKGSSFCLKINSVQGSNLYFCQNVSLSSFVSYSDECSSVNNCFGCVGLHSHEHHCILNKPYSVAEYEQLCGKIIDHMRSTGEWGEFFPHELSPFGYNETVAQEYFPMTKEEVKGMPRFSEWRFPSSSGEVSASGAAQTRPGDPGENTTQGVLNNSQAWIPAFAGMTGNGWNWYDEPIKTFEGTSYSPLPISEYDEKKVGFEVAQKNIDEVLAGIVKCEVTGKPFKIIRQELAFYIENSLPLPIKHPDQRHKERMDLRNPRTLFERKCDECNKNMITTYAPDRPEKVVCEECYRKLVY